MKSVVCMHQPEHGLQELRAHVVVTALALDRLGNERRNVVRVLGKRRSAWRSARSSAAITSSR